MAEVTYFVVLPFVDAGDGIAAGERTERYLATRNAASTRRFDVHRNRSEN